MTVGMTSAMPPLIVQIRTNTDVYYQYGIYGTAEWEFGQGGCKEAAREIGNQHGCDAPILTCHIKKH